MDSTTCIAHLNKCEVVRVVKANKQVVEPTTTTVEGPITPNSNRNFPFNCNSSLTSVELKRPLKVCCFDSNNDPFAQDGICVDDVETFSDEEMFESMYENLLEAIVTKQIEGLLAQISNVKWDSDVCKTPPLAPRLNGIVETCPNAPMKPSGKSRNIDLGLCRKLEF